MQRIVFEDVVSCIRLHPCSHVLRQTDIECHQSKQLTLSLFAHSCKQYQNCEAADCCSKAESTIPQQPAPFVPHRADVPPKHAPVPHHAYSSSSPLAVATIARQHDCKAAFVREYCGGCVSSPNTCEILRNSARPVCCNAARPAIPPFASQMCATAPPRAPCLHRRAAPAHPRQREELHMLTPLVERCQASSLRRNCCSAVAAGLIAAAADTVAAAVTV